VAITLVTLAAPALADAIPGCVDCSYAHGEVSGASGQFGEVSGAYEYRKLEAQGGLGSSYAEVALFGTSPKGFHFEAGASGSLATGALHATVAQAGGAADAFVELKDLVQFEFDPALIAAGVTRLTGTLSWTIEGRQEEVAGQSYASLGGNTGLSLLTQHGVGAQLNVDDFPWTTGNDPFHDGTGAFQATMSHDFTIISGEYYTLDAILSVYAGGRFAAYDPEGHELVTTAPSTADYGNTSYFNFTLPTGVKLLSGSGQLLTAPYVPGGAPSVPEPATWAMLILGFAAVGATLRRRRVHAAFA
jgi:hypothetical protein